MAASAKRILHLRGPLSTPGQGPGEPLGRMFPPSGSRRGFLREPGPWWRGPGPCPPPGPEDAWDEPPWEHQDRRHQRRWGWAGPRSPRPFPGPDGIPWNEEEDRIWAPHDFPPPSWDDREDLQGPQDDFGEGWHMPWPRGPRPFPGHDGIPWNEEEDRIRAPHDFPPPHWNYREEIRGPEDFTEDWYPELQSGPWSEFPKEEQHPPWPPAGPPRRGRGFRGGCPPWDCYPRGGRHCRPPRRTHRELTLVPRMGCPRPSREHKPPFKPSPPVSKPSQAAIKKELPPPDPPQPLESLQGAAERPELPQEPPVGSGEVGKPPEPAGTPPKSPAPDPCAVEPEQVEPEAGQTPVGSQDQDPSALGTGPMAPEENSAETEEHLKVEPCSPTVPEAGTGDGSYSQSPTAPLDPTEREYLASSSSGDVGAELSPHSWGQQCLPSGAGEAEAEAAHDWLLRSLQSPENSQVPPGPPAERGAQPSQACPDPWSTAQPSPGPLCSPGSAETKLVQDGADGQHQLCFTLPTRSPSRTELRSAAVLARKEEIELSYQQFSLTIAVVATMLLQKEPSMEAALGLALRANLRQGRIHHLQELEDFINNYDSATPSH
ncbi:basic proline-rich protein-like isoform X2 [Pithys albifrons albifrons]|uniref:basic proline-rich protein-like isoform X2 n=1 Tax=Pithys albifrons albifrons TaxID=3385563 RepID=UPI003A5CE81D